MDIASIAKRLQEIRMGILIKYPFYGNLIMGMKLSLADCGTAATDMRRIMFDPAFVERLSDKEIEFVMLHEVMHCVLGHCKRGLTVNQKNFNIAADIVVNSSILKEMGLSDISIDGDNAMHSTPCGDEGYNYTAEEVYDMILERINKDDDYGFGNSTLDNHDAWGNSGEDSIALDVEWKERIKEAIAKAAGTVKSDSLRKLFDDIEANKKVDWRSILKEFVQVSFEDKDYTFEPYDRRNQYSDFILPGFNDIEAEVIKNLWFVVDCSGSMRDELINEILAEVKLLADDFESFEARISFFDVSVTEPVAFNDAFNISDMQIPGGGGTSFHSIFTYMKENMSDDPPTAVVVLTDGYADYPSEDMAMKIPVLWMLYDNIEKAPWGVTVNL